MGSNRPRTPVSPSHDQYTFPGQLDQRDAANPEELPGQSLVMVRAGEVAQIVQHVEDPVVLHGTLTRIG
jgi:hypothetical protein